MTKFTRIEFIAGPNREGKFCFFLYWMADYHPGHPDGEYRTAERCQVFRADPRDYGFELPTDKTELANLKYNESLLKYR